MHLPTTGRPSNVTSILAGWGSSGAVRSCAITLLGVSALLTAHAQEMPAETGRIEEIVVTAQHREERIQDIPITMQAIGGEDLLDNRIKTPKDIARMVPGLFMNESALNQTDPEFTLRGIGTNEIGRAHV